MLSKYPQLINDKLCTTPCKVIVNGDINEDGEPTKYIYEGKCNYQSSCTRVLDEQERIIQITGKCYFSGNILPELDEIADGEVIIFGNKRRIHKGTKARNLDGSINYTLLELR